MDRKLRKMGNSLGIIIPSELLKKMQIEENDVLHLEYREELNEIVLTNKRTTPTMNLREYVVSVVKEYLDERDNR